MRKRKVAMALFAALLIAGGGWLLNQKRQPGSLATPKSMNAWDGTHEKALLTEQLRRSPAHTPILLRLAQIERGGGDLRAARNHLEQAAASDRKQVDVHLELGLVCWEMGDFAAAEEHNREVLRIDPTQPDALYNLGAIAANRGDPKLARQYWKEAIRSGRDADAVSKSRSAVERLEAMQ